MKHLLKHRQGCHYHCSVSLQESSYESKGKEGNLVWSQTLPSLSLLQTHLPWGCIWVEHNSIAALLGGAECGTAWSEPRCWCQAWQRHSHYCYPTLQTGSLSFVPTLTLLGRSEPHARGALCIATRTPSWSIPVPQPHTTTSMTAAQ